MCVCVCVCVCVSLVPSVNITGFTAMCRSYAPTFPRTATNGRCHSSYERRAINISFSSGLFTHFLTNDAPPRFIFFRPLFPVVTAFPTTRDTLTYRGSDMQWRDKW